MMALPAWLVGLLTSVILSGAQKLINFFVTLATTAAQKAGRDAKVEDAIQKYNDAQTDQEQEDALKNVIDSSRSHQ